MTMMKLVLVAMTRTAKAVAAVMVFDPMLVLVVMARAKAVAAVMVANTVVVMVVMARTARQAAVAVVVKPVLAVMTRTAKTAVVVYSLVQTRAFLRPKWYAKNFDFRTCLPVICIIPIALAGK